MAELHVQRKDPTIWPWVLLGLAILALILWLVFGRSDEQAERLAGQADSTFQSAPGMSSQQGTAAGQLDDITPAVARFIQFAEQGSRADASLSHAYTANGLRQLTAALREIIETDEVSGVEVKPRLDEIQQRANDLERDPSATSHALKTREAFLMAAGLMSQTQQEGDAETSAQVQHVMTAAEAVRANVLLLEQTAEIQRFFDQSAIAVRAMAGDRLSRSRR